MHPPAACKAGTLPTELIPQSISQPAGSTQRAAPEIVAHEPPASAGLPPYAGASFASRALTRRFRLTPSSAAFIARARWVSGGTRTTNLPL